MIEILYLICFPYISFIIIFLTKLESVISFHLCHNFSNQSKSVHSIALQKYKLFLGVDQL